MSSPSPKFPRKIAASAAAVLGFLIPVKFGSLVLPDSAGLFQENAVGWLLNPWPCSLFGVLAGITALLAVAAYPAALRKRPEGRVAALFAGAVALACAGVFNADNRQYAQVQLIYLTGLALWGAAVAVLLAGRPGFDRALLKAWLAGVAVVLALGLYQYFFGFDELLEYIREERERGAAISTVIEAKVAARRVHAPFDLPNSLAGFLLISVIPLALVRPGRGAGGAVASGVLWLAWGFVLVATGSRAALAALAAAAVLFVLTSGYAKKRPYLTGGAALAVLLGAAAAIFYAGSGERGLGSLRSRADYAKTALKMTAEHPIIGGGWGEFRFNYMRDKDDGAEEAPRAPHNMFLAFSAQSGAPSAALLLAAVGYPFFLAFRRKRGNATLRLMAAALFGYLLHSCADVNLQTPACAATMLTAALLMAHRAAPAEPAERSRPVRQVVLAAAVLAATAMQVFEFVADRRFHRFLDNPTPDAAQKALALQPGNAVVPLRLGYRLAGEGDAPGALAQFSRAAEMSPRDPDPWVAMLELEVKRRNPAGAERALAEARERFPNNWLLEGTPEEAAAKLKKARSLK